MLKSWVVRVCHAVIGLAMLTHVACSPRPRIWLFNNTGATIAILTESEVRCSAQQGESCVFWYSDSFFVRVGRSDYRYSFPDGLNYESRPEWIASEFPSRRIIKLQIDSDRAVFILRATAVGIEKPPHSPQRAGFPLHPSTEAQ